MADALSQENRAHAMALIRAAVKASNVKAVAERLGYSRPCLSRLINDDYPNPDKVFAAALLRLDRHPCPWFGDDVAGHYCIELNTGPVPTWNPTALDHRRACRACHHKPRKE